MLALDEQEEQAEANSEAKEEVKEELKEKKAETDIEQLDSGYTANGDPGSNAGRVRIHPQ